MQIEIEGIEIELRDVTRLEWLDLDISSVSPSGELQLLDPKLDYLELLARRVSYAVTKWGDQDGIAPAEIVHNAELHNIAVAIADWLDEQAGELPMLQIKRAGDQLTVWGDDFSAQLQMRTIAELRAFSARCSDMSNSQRKAEMISFLALDWDGHGAVTAEDLLGDRAKSHLYILAVEEAITPFFRSPTIIVKSSKLDDDGDRDERGADVSPVAILA